MARILFVHWKEPGADHLVQRLRDDGHEVIVESHDAHTAWNRIRDEDFDLLAISVNGKPSEGLTAAGATRNVRLKRIPLVLVGASENVRQRARDEYPAAFFASWGGLPEVVEALVNPNVTQPSPGAAPRP